MSVEQTSPLYSVVILSHNRMEALQRTIASIRTQQLCTYEIIVIDGASSDGTLDYLEENAGKDIHYVVLPYESPYEALNYGATLAEGVWTLFLLAGDELYDSMVFHKAIAYIEGSEYYNVDVFMGNVALQQSEGEVVFEPMELEYLETGLPFSTEGTLIRTRALRTFPLDTRLHYAADYAFFYRLWRMNHGFSHLMFTLTRLDPEGEFFDEVALSKEYAAVKRSFDEESDETADEKKGFWCCLWQALHHPCAHPNPSPLHPKSDFEMFRS